MLPKANVLIVEDSFIVAFHLKTTLESEGYHVAGSQDSGEGALAFLAKNKVDLVLMDIMVNGRMDGIETARIIKLKYNLPLIYITALTDKDTIQRAKITEPYGYLTKPFEDREIITVIEMALYKHKIQSKLQQSEEKYFSTVRSISDVVIVIDQQYCVTYVNPSAENIIGKLSKDILGTSIFGVLKLKNFQTEEFPVNPLQCPLNGSRVNSMLDDLVLISSDKKEIFIGEGSLSAVIDSKSELAGLVIVFKDTTEKREHEKLRRNFEKERLAALLEGQEKERNRIAKDLHDGLGQMLTAIKMNVKILMNDEAKENDLYRLIDEAIQESVRISENLLPSRLNDFDLATCLKSLCNQIKHSTQRQVTFDSLGNTPQISQNQKINFYRIAQEAINNAIKHADASLISVQLNQESEQIRLSIEDDGKGIDNTGSLAKTNKGLINMRERAQIMEGKLTIESDENRGTLVIVEAPVDSVTVDKQVADKILR